MTGISDSMVADAPRFHEVARQIVEFTEGSIFVAHNVRFDYTFIKKEFHDLGYNFQRKRLCTVRLSRKLIPGQPSYSLGKLCKNIGIPLTDRHRAMGDAKATALLFEKMLAENQADTLLGMLDAEIKSALVPAGISKEKAAEIPEVCGVYYFYNAAGKVIYVGKSTNIRKRIGQHFAVDHKSNKDIEFKNSIADITWEPTGSELIALLLESDEIKRLKPLHNVAQRRTVYSHGLFNFTDENGYINFRVARLKDDSMPLLQVASALGSKELLYNLAKNNRLCLKLCDLYKTETSCFDYSVHECNGACIGKESPDEYNQRALAIIKRFSFDTESFAIIGKGRTASEKSVVWVERNRYLGFGYFDTDGPTDLESLRDCIHKYTDNRDIQQILRGHLRKPGADKIITLPKEPSAYTDNF